MSGRLKCIELVNGKVRLIDQTQLPERLVFVETDDYRAVCTAIRRLQVRGAPAIGIAGAFGLLMGVRPLFHLPEATLLVEMDRIAAELDGTRPTARNLRWALDRLRARGRAAAGRGSAAIIAAVEAEAAAVFAEDEAISRRLADNGAALLEPSATVLTHCNTGFLVTAGIGTALGVVYAAVEQGKTVRVFADETRPLLQGARLTAWELVNRGIDVTVICDGAAAHVLRTHHIDCCIVGADRIAANGDVANKIGTYNLAVQARHHEVPFYVAAPYSTFDLSIPDGTAIPIEERSPEEVTAGFGRRTAPEGVQVYNPAFDVTPASLVSAFITEVGVFHPPYGAWEKLKRTYSGER